MLSSLLGSNFKEDSSLELLWREEKKNEIKLDIKDQAQEENQPGENLITILDTIRNNLDKEIVAKRDLGKLLNKEHKEGPNKMEKTKFAVSKKKMKKVNM